MTSNQIAYAKHREEARHNRVQERHEHRQTDALASQAETARMRAVEEGRHNLEQERTNWWSAQEQGRHNLRTEDINFMTGSSQVRYQGAMGVAALRNAASSERQAAVSERNAYVNERNAAVNERLASVSENTLAETIRHNGVFEAETSRHNVMQEQLESSRLAEIRRSNLSNEGIARSQVALGYGNLAELQRSNKAREAQTSLRDQYNYQIASESNRIAARNTAIQAERNAEQVRANRVQEKQRNTEMRNANRHYWAMDEVAKYNAESQRFKAAASGVRDVSDVAKTFVGFIGGLL